MRVYEALVRGLEEVGVDTVFGGAGENAAGMMLALDQSHHVRGIITKNEQAAAFAACGYAMFTGKLGVCFATAGPGAFNLIAGLAVALTDSYPLLAISGYSSVKWTGKGSLNETSGVGRTPDSQAMFDATTKANYLVTDPADIPRVLQEAIDIAFDGRPGPVHIAVAEDITDPEIEVPNFVAPRIRPKPVAPEPDRVAAVADYLVGALRGGKKVVLLAGYGAVRSRAGAEIREFVERYQVPVLTTLDGKGIIPEEHPLALGVFASSGHKSAWECFLDADVVVAIGNSFSQLATFGFRDDLFEGRELVHINIDPGEIDKVYQTALSLVSDARLAMAAINRATAAALEPLPVRRYRAPDFDEQRIVRFTSSLHPGQMSQAISRLLPDGGVVLADAGAHAAWLGYYLELREGQNFRKPGTFGPMGIGVNGALGVKAAEPHRTVVAAVGDGSYLMAGFELLTAVEHNLPVIWVIFNDGEFKLIKLYQISAFQKTGLAEFKNPDYLSYARACGADGYRAETLAQFERAFTAALASGRPTLIDASITRLALPHYGPTPEGVLAGVKEMIATRIRQVRAR